MTDETTKADEAKAKSAKPKTYKALKPFHLQPADIVGAANPDGLSIPVSPGETLPQLKAHAQAALVSSEHIGVA